MNNKINNPKKKVSKTREMNDKDYITSMLEVEKSIVKDYAVALTEASNKDLYEDFHDMFDDVSDLQRQIYDLMFRKGWYSLETAEEDIIIQKANKLEQELPQLVNNG